MRKNIPQGLTPGVSIGLLGTARAELRLLYPVAAMAEPGGGVVGGYGFESLCYGLIEDF
jgi:hypothetical protein